MKAVPGSAFMVACGVVAPLFLSVPAAAQEIDQNALTDCLVANTTDEHLAAMKRLMIAALQDDSAAMKTEVTNYGNIIVQMAITSCKVEASQLQDPAVAEAIGAYGERIGEKMMTDAFAKIGQ